MRCWETITIENGPQERPAVYTPILGRYQFGDAKLRRQLRHPNLVNPVLVSIAGDTFTHLLNLPAALSDDVMVKIVKERRQVIRLSVFYLALSVVGILTIADPDIRTTLQISSSLLAAVIGYLVIDHALTFRYPDRLRERASYYGWLFLAGRPYIVVTLGFYLASAAFQWGMGDNIPRRFGLVYEAALQGEAWRVMTGSLIHASFAHWLGNLMIAIAVAAFVGPSLRRWFAIVFVVGGFSAFGLALLFHLYVSASDYTGVVGTSGGLSALIACQLGLCLKYKDWYPKHFYVTVGFFLAVNMLIGSLLQDHISAECHFFGALSGLLFACWLPNKLIASSRQ